MCDNKPRSTLLLRLDLLIFKNVYEFLKLLVTTLIFFLILTNEQKISNFRLVFVTIFHFTFKSFFHEFFSTVFSNM